MAANTLSNHNTLGTRLVKGFTLFALGVAVASAPVKSLFESGKGKETAPRAHVQNVAQYLAQEVVEGAKPGALVKSNEVVDRRTGIANQMTFRFPNPRYGIVYTATLRGYAGHDGFIDPNAVNGINIAYNTGHISGDLFRLEQDETGDWQLGVGEPITAPYINDWYETGISGNEDGHQPLTVGELKESAQYAASVIAQRTQVCDPYPERLCVR